MRLPSRLPRERSLQPIAAVVCAAVAVAAAGAPRALPARAQDACAPAVDKTAAPARIPLGEAVTVTLQLGGACPARDRKADVVLVVDRSNSMARDGKLEATKAAAHALIDAMDTRLVQIGVVAFDEAVETMAVLTTDRAALHQAIDDIAYAPGTNLVDGLDAGRRLLASAAHRLDATPVIVFMTDGRHRVRTPPIEAIDPVIAAVRAAGIETYTVGLGTDVDAALLARIADDPSKYYQSPTPAELTAIYLEIVGRIEASVLFQTVTLVDRLPANMTFEPGSARPIAPAVSADGRTLTWTLAGVPLAGLALTYRVRPTEAGTHPTNVEAVAGARDGLGADHRLVFPVPTVLVTAPEEGAQCVCRIVRDRVPPAVVEHALANPMRVFGWQILLDPGKPDQPPNPRRACLDLQNRGIPFHPLFNGVLWRAGCTVGP